jgi:hypothetical protein
LGHYFFVWNYQRDTFGSTVMRGNVIFRPYYPFSVIWFFCIVCQAITIHKAAATHPVLPLSFLIEQKFKYRRFRYQKLLFKFHFPPTTVQLR